MKKIIITITLLSIACYSFCQHPIFVLAHSINIVVNEEVGSWAYVKHRGVYKRLNEPTELILFDRIRLKLAI